MKSIIKEIFYGERGNTETYKPSEEYFKILDKISALHSVIESELTDGQKENFEKFCELQEELDVESADKHFIEGVKLGILIGIETCN